MEKPEQVEKKAGGWKMSWIEGVMDDVCPTMNQKGP